MSSPTVLIRDGENKGNWVTDVRSLKCVKLVTKWWDAPVCLRSLSLLMKKATQSKSQLTVNQQYYFPKDTVNIWTLYV